MISELSVNYQVVMNLTQIQKVSKQLAWLYKSFDLAAQTRKISLSVSLGLLTEEDVEEHTIIGELSKDLSFISNISITRFPSATPNALVHNALARRAQSDLIIISKCGVLTMPTAIDRLVAAFEENSTLGICDGKQIPFEIPLDTGYSYPETSWCSRTFMMIRYKSFQAVSGFDENFLLNGEDVDLSWRIKLAKFSAYHIPSAVLFDTQKNSRSLKKDKVSQMAIFSPMTRLLLPWKWSRDDVLEETIQTYDSSGESEKQKALVNFFESKAKQTLPERIADPEKVAVFESPNFTRLGSGFLR